MRWVAVLLALHVSGCERETRNFQQPAARTQSVAVSDLYPGGGRPPTSSDNPAERNAYSLAEGKTLFSTYNCTGCHANGGGGMGPALMDDEWIYGYQPEQIFRTILEGRPNGMPAFRQKIPDYQIWEIAGIRTTRWAASSRKTRRPAVTITSVESRLSRRRTRCGRPIPASRHRACSDVGGQVAQSVLDPPGRRRRPSKGSGGSSSGFLLGRIRAWSRLPWRAL